MSTFQRNRCEKKKREKLGGEEDECGLSRWFGRAAAGLTWSLSIYSTPATT